MLVSAKIDRQQLIKLADVQRIRTLSKQDVQQEQNTIEAFYSALTDIGIPLNHINRSFLAAGGSSLNALTLISKLHRIGFYDLTVEHLMCASSLKDILNHRSVIEQTLQNHSFFQINDKYEVISLENIDKFMAQHVLTESFIELSDIDSLVHNHQAELKHRCKLEWFALLDAIWPYYVASGLSFGLVTNDGQLVGVALSKDLADQPDIDLPDMPLLTPLFEMFEIGRNECIEDLRSRHLLPESILHGFLTAVNPDVKSEHRITIMYLLERQVLNIATLKRFQAVITANASSVTQQLAKQIFRYDFNHVVYANQYRDSNGTLIFPNAQDHHTAIISMKLLNES